MPICPLCNSPMPADRVVSLAGVQEKEVSWRCERDGVQVGAVHPVQISHLRVGSEDEQGGRRTRIIKLEMQGAELLVFRQPLDPAGPAAPTDA
jgi:hypothetical protein